MYVLLRVMMIDVCSQIEDMEAQMAKMQQSHAVLAEAETSLRQQVSSLQVSCPPAVASCTCTETLACKRQRGSLLETCLASFFSKLISGQAAKVES